MTKTAKSPFRLIMAHLIKPRGGYPEKQNKTKKELRSKNEALKIPQQKLSWRWVLEGCATNLCKAVLKIIRYVATYQF